MDNVIVMSVSLQLAPCGLCSEPGDNGIYVNQLRCQKCVLELPWCIMVLIEVYHGSDWGVSWFWLWCIMVLIEVYYGSDWGVSWFWLWCIMVLIVVYHGSDCVVSWFWLRCIMVLIEVYHGSDWGVSWFWLRCIMVLIVVYHGSDCGVSWFWLWCIMVLIVVYHKGFEAFRFTYSTKLRIFYMLEVAWKICNKNMKSEFFPRQNHLPAKFWRYQPVRFWEFVQR